MHPQTIRRIDYWLGVPLCALLTLVRGAWPRQSTPPRKVVFLKFIEQGATVLAQDAVARATALVGREHVYFCVFESNRPILELLGLVPADNIIAISDKSLVTCALGFLRALRRIRSTDIDTSIDMEFFSRASAIFAFLAGATTRVGLHRFTSELPYRGDLLTHRVQYSPYLHVSTQYALLVEALRQPPSADDVLLKVALPSPQALAGTASEVPRPAGAAFSATQEETAAIFESLARAGMIRTGHAQGPPGPVVLLNPNASDLLPLRKWPGARFVELGRRILERHPTALVVVTGAPAERPAAEALCGQIGSPRAISLAGRTTLRELLTLYSIGRVLVTNDSGPAHFASMTSVSTVVLFGPETPQLFGPLSPSGTVVWKQLACSPCVSVFNHRFSPCRDNVCMQMITVEEVYAAVAGHLSDLTRAGAG